MQVNKFGVKTGDIFYLSWGVEQTNVSFYQVIQLAGTSSARVVEVIPDITVETVSYMSRYIKVSVKKESYPRTKRFTFIKDNENGDLKRITNYGAVPAIKINDHYAYLYRGQKLYESWYA